MANKTSQQSTNSTFLSLSKELLDSQNSKIKYNFAYLNEDSKREIRRALLKAVAVPGYQVPFGGIEMPMPYGWGTGGIQVTASVIGENDILKVIDQGSDDTTNAVAIRAFFQKVAGVQTVTDTLKATIIQTRHRIPQKPLKEGQIMVYQVPVPEPLRWLEPREVETRTLHGLEEYGLMYLKLYEDIVRHGDIATSYDYPVMVNGRYAMSPSPIPRYDTPKLNFSPALHLFGAGREKRIYAIPPYTQVVPFDFSDHPFKAKTWEGCCELCGDDDSYLDEIVTDDKGGRLFVCSDTDHCQSRLSKSGPGITGSDLTGADGKKPS
jgi:alpha-D-ribose 1-methylphosphonate 5-phosphate C-P lyase